MSETASEKNTSHNRASSSQVGSHLSELESEVEFLLAQIRQQRKELSKESINARLLQMQSGRIIEKSSDIVEGARHHARQLGSDLATELRRRRERVDR